MSNYIKAMEVDNEPICEFSTEMKGEAMHTKGPWKINNNIGHKGELGIIADTAPCIIAIMGNQKVWPAEAEANAHLIAAAPDLLEACKALLEEFNSRTALIETCDMTDDELVAIQKAEQAIAKTEGRD
jgi:hypothetical protein